MLTQPLKFFACPVAPIPVSQCAVLVNRRTTLTSFLSVPLILARERHVKLDFLVNSLSPRGQRILNTTTSLVGTLACGLLFWYGLQVTLHDFETNSLLWRAVIVPKGLISMAIPVGSFFLTIQFLRRTWLYATKS